LLNKEKKELEDTKRALKEISESNELFRKEEEEFKKNIEKHNKMLAAKAAATLWIQAHWQGHLTRTEKKKR
jgi:hypothetical protein